MVVTYFVNVYFLSDLHKLKFRKGKKLVVLSVVERNYCNTNVVDAVVLDVMDELWAADKWRERTRCSASGGSRREPRDLVRK